MSGATERMRTRPLAALIAARTRQLGMSDRTADLYADHLCRLEDWCGENALRIEQTAIAAWLARDAPIAPASRLMAHNAARFLVRSLRGETVDPLLLPRPRCPPPRPVQARSPREIATLIAAIPAALPRLFVQFLYATGMRAQEALAVTSDDLEPSDGTVLVRRGKGGRQRRTILPATLVETLAAADRLPPRWRGPIFVHPNGRPLVMESGQRAMMAARKRLGMSNGPSLHGLRHAFATHLHARGVGVGELRLLLGHQSLAVTMRYLGLHGERRQDIARIGDLLGALRELAPQQERLSSLAR